MSELTDRRLEERDRRRNEILDAAVAVAAESGFDAISMEQIARRARLSRALVYVYFQHKAAVHVALCERALNMLLELFAAATRNPADGLAHLSAMGRAYVAFSQQHPVYFEALARFEARSVQDMEQRSGDCLALGDQCHQHIKALIQAGIEDGSIRSDVGAPDAVAIALWGIMHGVIQIVATRPALLTHRNTDAEAVYEHAMVLTLRGIATHA